MKVFVAGGSGLAGNAIVKKFAQEGFDVFAPSSKVLDLTNYEATQQYMSKVKPNIVIDAAAKVGGILANSKFPVDFLTQNLLIQNNLMKASSNVNVEKFIFLGSSCIYPRDCSQPIKEEYLLTGKLEESNSAYAIAKIAGVELVNAYRTQYGKKWISLMPTNLYGPNDNFNLETAHVLPALIRKFIEAKESNASCVHIWGDGTPLREFLYVDDLAEAVFVTYLDYDSSIPLNVGSGEEISIKDLANLISQLIGYDGRIDWDSTKPTGTPRKILDSARINALGWVPRTTLKIGIQSVINWYLDADKNGMVRK